MIYAQPGTPGAVITFKPRYGNFIGGEFVAPINGEYFTNTSPVNGEVIAEFPRSSAADIDKALDAAFICGPQEMTETVRDSLKAKGMQPERIHFELFAAVGSEQKRAAREAARQVDAAVSQITVISDGRALAFDLPRNSQSILDAGNEQGAELPYSCKAGVCSTCKCKVIEGEVEMDSNHALEDYEVAAGYVLSCQAFPISDKVVLDFDQL